MALADIVRSAVKVADRVTSDLQVTLRHERFLSQGTYGTPAYAAEKPLKVIGERKQTTRRLRDGREVLIEATLTIPRAVTLDIRDRLTWPDGKSWPILEIGGPDDPANGTYLTTVLIGNVAQERVAG